MLSNKRRFIAGCSLAFSLYAYIGNACALTWPLLSYPPGAQVEPMGQRLRHNGYQMRITRFTVNQKPEQVLQFFQNSWKSSKPSHAIVNNWHILTKKEGDFVTTIEVQADLSNRSQGVSAIRFTQDIRTLEQGIPKSIPIPSGTYIASLLESEDYGRQAVTILLFASAPPLSIHRFYKRELAMRGWSLKERNTETSSDASVNTLFIGKASHRGMVQTTRAGGMTQSVIHIDHED